MEATHWWGPHPHGFWIIPLVFMIVMCLLVGLMARRAGGWRCGVGCIGPRHYGWQEGSSETPRQILDRRYASGEITKEQHEQMRRDLEGEYSRSRSGDG
jgi:putative membrane protein